MTRNLAMVGLLGAAVGGPYVVSQSPSWSPAWGPNTPVSQQVGQTVNPSLLARPSAEAPRGPGSEVYRRPAPFEGRIQRSLNEVLRWEITKGWVFRSWDRKSTGLADSELFGVRVPVVTGRGMADVAGALSYYFDSQGTLQRIRLVGTTADTNGVAHLAATRFGLRRRVSASPGDQLFQAEENGQVRSQLRTRPEAVLWGTSPHNSFRIELEANRPGSPFWVRAQQPPLDLPPAATTTNPSTAGPQVMPNDGQPVFPPRSVVPDDVGAATATVPATVSQPPPAGPATTASQAPSVTPTKSDGDIEPLDSYRNRFRWPD
ncbi:MAG: DUF6690 family protein [Planctomycetota bacterium]